MKPSRLYIILTVAIFLLLAVVFLFFPRSTYSELEKRELAKFPEFSTDKLKGARYTSEVSQWFSDTEPYRDVFMAFSMSVRDKLRYSFGSDEETISFHATDSGSDAPAPGTDPADIAEYENHVNANENAKIASAGIMIVGKEPTARALNAFGGEANGGGDFVKVVSQYSRELPGVKVYAMVIPLSSEFYTPDKAKSRTKPQLPFIKNVYSRLTDGAKGVNAYTALADHVEEDIYLRTDHHWAPLGAYYAAQEFARTAGVPFKDLKSYDRKVVHGYVGSMYGYSKDIAIKNSPEDFVYYVPKGLNSQTTYCDYIVNADYQVTGERAPAKGNFFYHYKDGSGGAYCTFMGGDQRLTHVKTGSSTGRRLLIIKDSYGNPVPSFLFYSFDDIYVVDFRYFSRNMKKFVADNRVTDLLFALNIFNAYAPSSAAKMKKFLTQNDGTYAAPTPAKKSEDSAERPTAVEPAQPATPSKDQPATPSKEPSASPEPTPNETPKEAADLER